MNRKSCKCGSISETKQKNRVLLTVILDYYNNTLYGAGVHNQPQIAQNYCANLLALRFSLAHFGTSENFV